jgi:phosphatidylglycerophosphate synthase
VRNNLLVATIGLATIVTAVWMLRARSKGASQSTINKALAAMQLLLLSGIVASQPPTELIPWLQIVIALCAGVVIGSIATGRADKAS